MSSVKSNNKSDMKLATESILSPVFLIVKVAKTFSPSMYSCLSVLIVKMKSELLFSIFLFSEMKIGNRIIIKMLK